MKNLTIGIQCHGKTYYIKAMPCHNSSNPYLKVILVKNRIHGKAYYDKTMSYYNNDNPYLESNFGIKWNLTHMPYQLSKTFEKMYGENKPSKVEFYEIEHHLNNDIGQESGNGANKYFQWLRRTNNFSGKANLNYYMLYLSSKARRVWSKTLNVMPC